jgi:hypothetical protein
VEDVMGITKEFENGEMIIKQDGVELRRITSEQLQNRIDNLNQRLDFITAELNNMILKFTDWKNQADASVE